MRIEHEAARKRNKNPDDADADEALVTRIDLAGAGDGLDRGAALLVTRPDRNLPLTA